MRPRATSPCCVVVAMLRTTRCPRIGADGNCPAGTFRAPGPQCLSVDVVRHVAVAKGGVPKLPVGLILDGRVCCWASLSCWVW